MPRPPNRVHYSHTLENKSSPAFNFGAAVVLEVSVERAAGAAGAEPQSPKSSSAMTFGGAGVDEPNPPSPDCSAVEDCIEPHPPESLAAVLLVEPQFG